MKRLLITVLIMTMFAGTAIAAITGPSSLTNTAKTNTTATFTWTNEATQDSVKFYIDTVWNKSVVGTLETAQLTGLAPGTTYSVHAEGDSSGTTASSDTLSVQVYYPLIDGPRYSSVLEADLRGIMADSWGETEVTSVTLSGAAARDSTVALAPFDATTFQCNATGHADSTLVVVRFYGGRCTGPYYVTLQDTLSITAPGVHRKELDIGPDSHIYAVFDGQTNNGNATAISEMWWTLRRPGAIR